MDALLNHHQSSEESQDFRFLEEFSNCAGKLYWVAFVLIGDDKKARELMLPAVDDAPDFNTFFGEWLCRWIVRIVITSCARHHEAELSREKGSGDRWRSKLTAKSNHELQTVPFLKEQLQCALLRVPLFPRSVFLLHVLERYPMPEVASILNVDEDSCEGSLSYAYFALSEALMSTEGRQGAGRPEPKDAQDRGVNEVSEI